MVISENVLAFRDDSVVVRPRALIAAALRIAFAALLVAVIAAVPAEAKRKKRVRVLYSPPQAAMVVDAYSGKVLFEQNADKSRFPASITKVMTLYLLFEQIKKGDFTADTPLKVSAWAASRAPSKLGLDAGDTISVHDAIGALVTKSANDVASVVAENIAGSEEAFARMMTHKARLIGMKDTNFANASGLPNPNQKTTARDLVTLARRVLIDFPEESKVFQMRYFEYGEKTFANHNRLLFSYAGMEGMKTGYTQASGFNLLASCRRDNKRLIAVVLGGSSSKNRNGRMRTLLDRSWRAAVAMRGDLKNLEAVQSVAVANVVQPDMMPERNPAFHDTDDHPMTQASVMRELDDPAAASAPEAKAEPETKADVEAEVDEVGEDSARKLALAKEGAEAEEVADTDGDTTAQGDAKADLEVKVEPAALKSESAPQPAAQKQEAIFGPYHVQVGSFLDTQSAKRRLETVSDEAEDILDGRPELTVSGDVDGRNYYRARFGKFSRQDAASTCKKLKRIKLDCLVVRVE